MARILLVEDDPDQRLLRRLILERAGHEVAVSASPAEALASTAEADVLLMDLRLPEAGDGRELIRAFRLQRPGVPIVVLTGCAAELVLTPEQKLVDAVLDKPVRTERLLKTIAQMVLAVVMMVAWAVEARGQSREFAFNVDRGGEVVARLKLASTGGDWGEAGREAAMASVTLDGVAKQNVMVFGGAKAREYAVFLGRLAAGRHRLQVEREGRLSAAGAGLSVEGLEVETAAAGSAREAEIAHAPVLLARANTVGRFSDVPLMAYTTRGSDGDGAYIEYTIVFSNEDGGTSTRDLMARWGRPTDIEYIYRVWLDGSGAVKKTLIQTRDHQDVPYQGRREGTHPVLVPVTDNNMVEPAPAGEAPVRYQLAPVAADLSQGSRELVMDAHPVTYEISAKEMKREGKLRAPGQFRGEDIADPRLYLVVEMKLASENAAAQVLVKLRGAAKWRGSAMGIAKNFIERGGWARTAIELPPGTGLSDVEELGAECLSRRDLVRQPVPKNGSCRVEAFGRIFFLDEKYAPGPTLAPPAAGWSLKVGEMATARLR